MGGAMYDVAFTLRTVTALSPLSGSQTDGLARLQLLAFADPVGLPRAGREILDEALSSTENLADDLESGAQPFSSQVLWNVGRRLRNGHKSAAPRLTSSSHGFQGGDHTPENIGAADRSNAVSSAAMRSS